MDARSSAITLAIIGALYFQGCGFLFNKDLKKYDEMHGGKLSSNLETPEKSEPIQEKMLASSVRIPEVQCVREKTDLEFASGTFETLFRRQITEEERKDIATKSLDREAFISEMIESSEAQSGYTTFLSNLFQLSKIEPAGNFNNADDAMLAADLRQEPIVLVLRNIDKPWKYFFTTNKIYCTPATANVYGISATSDNGFEECELPDHRAGFLGMASVLRAQPSSMFTTNNNRHRVAFALYLAQGFKLLDNTNGPRGGQKGITMADCVPKTDLRIMESGTVYGTAAVPTVDGSCASCHSKQLAPLEIAFRRFDERGRDYTFDRVEGTQESFFRDIGSSRGQAKYLLNELTSCWSSDGVRRPEVFTGVPGLGRLIADSGTLGKALGVQIPQNLGNITPDANMKATIQKHFEDGEETLKDAVKGFFLSKSFQCAFKAEEDNDEK